MIINLGVGLTSATANASNGTGEAMANGDGEMEVEESHPHTNGVNGNSYGNNDGAAPDEEADWGALALFESVVEEREDRIREEDIPVILGIIRETLDENYGS